MTFQPQLSADQRVNVVRAEGTSVARQTTPPPGYQGPPKNEARIKSNARKRRRREARERAAKATRTETFLPAKVETPTEGAYLKEVAKDVTYVAAKGGLRRDIEAFFESTGGIAAAEYEYAKQGAQVVPALLPGGKGQWEAHEEYREAGEALDAEWEAYRAYGQKPDGLLGYLGQGALVAGAWVSGGLTGLVTGVEVEAAPPASSLLLTPGPNGHFAETRGLIERTGTRIADARAEDARAEERAELREAKRLLGGADVAEPSGIALPSLPSIHAAPNEEADADAGEAGAIDVPGVGVPAGPGDEEGDTKGGSGSHGILTTAGGLVASATAGVAAAGRKVKKKLKGRAAAVPAAPPVPVPPAPRAPVPVSEVPPMDDITSLSAFDRMKDAAEGAKAKLSAALDDLPAPSSGGLSTMALPALAVGATAAGVGTVTALALAKESKPRKKASRKKKAARKPMKRKAKAKGKVRRKSKHSHAREDRSGRVVTKKTYRGKKVHWTKNGQPYVYQADGRPRFIKR